MVRTLAEEVIVLNSKIAETDKLIENRFRRHELAEMICSLPGIGAEFLAATGGDMDFFATPDRLAAFAGLAPAPRDSGRIHGNLHRPQRYHRGLQRVSTPPRSSASGAAPSRALYDRKRAEGKRTPKPCSRSHADALTSCGHSSVTDGATRRHRPSVLRLDNSIRKSPRVRVRWVAGRGDHDLGEGDRGDHREVEREQHHPPRHRFEGVPNAHAMLSARHG